MDKALDVEVWVDFNEQDDQGRVLTLRRFADPSVDLSLGASVVVGDHEGNRCRARVADIADTVVALALESDTFKPSEPVERMVI